MVGIGILSAMFLWAVLHNASLWWLPGVYVVALLVANWRRFWAVIMPALWRSLVVRAVGERGRGRGLVLDEWVD